jgi:hypothetical protein
LRIASSFFFLKTQTNVRILLTRLILCGIIEIQNWKEGGKNGKTTDIFLCGYEIFFLLPWSAPKGD